MADVAVGDGYNHAISNGIVLEDESDLHGEEELTVGSSMGDNAIDDSRSSLINEAGQSGILRQQREDEVGNSTLEASNLSLSTGGPDRSLIAERE